MVESVKNLIPSNPDISNLRILLYGAVGAGKSSFINSLNSVSGTRVVTKAQTVPSGACMSCTKRCCYVSYSSIFDLYLQFNSDTPLSPKDPRYISTPSNREKTHCVVCVVSANTISQMPQATTDKMKAYLDEARELGIPQAVIMTMGDEICPAVKYTVKTIYMSKKIKQKMKECSDKLQVSMTCIFPVRNYSEETETNNDVDVLLLLALRQIAYLANDYVEDLGHEDHEE
ncbi:interferon-induced protein 44-like [Clarias gariepinus]|uniref:interferon-induced protein 44-like n=1 Tax=Clarias gariepinus TaxID=13013 RepID=UPI00234C2352|nr:interferon-induced protein 44-like [Clarias gariepinus]